MGSDGPQHSAGGPDGLGSQVTGYHSVPAAFPPAALHGGGVRPCTEPLGVSAQCVRQEKPLPLQVGPLPVYPRVLRSNWLI